MSEQNPIQTSSLRFNYLLRPRKGIERKLLLEAFQHLNCFGMLNDYSYVGFGAFYFADFKLFHKHLGIRKMVSIEGDLSIEKRVKFNKPYANIDIRFETSGKFLKNHRWDRSIVWLDYDQILHLGQISDCESMARRLPSTSVFLITTETDTKELENSLPAAVKINLERLAEKISSLRLKPSDAAEIRTLLEECGAGEIKLRTLRERIDANLPIELREKDITQEKMPSIVRDVLLNAIEKALSIRNIGKNSNDRIVFKQLFFFSYADGRRMMTFGGILVTQAEWQKLSATGILERPYIKTGNEPFEINVPQLTIKEKLFLDDLMPGLRESTEFKLAPEEMASYRELYRYYPTYSELES